LLLGDYRTTVAGFDIIPPQADAYEMGFTLMTIFALMPSFTLMTSTLFKLMAIICINRLGVKGLFIHTSFLKCRDFAINVPSKSLIAG
jgi:hypothetical protein